MTISLSSPQSSRLYFTPSVFGKDEDNIVDWIEKGYATYINKEKALNYLHHSALNAVTSERPRLIVMETVKVENS